jgi:hypothetical protein
MGYIKEQIKAMSKEYGSTAKAKSASTKWFSESMAAKDALNAKPTRKRFEAGKIYVFKYENPITEEKLPWFDRAPVVLALDTIDHTDVGINLNLLPSPFRQQLLDALYTKLKGKIETQLKGVKKDDARKQAGIKEFTYESAKIFLDRYGFGFAVRRYLPNLKKGQAVVSYESWPKIALAEFAKIKGATVTQIRKEFIDYNRTFRNKETGKNQGPNEDTKNNDNKNRNI